MFDFEELQSAVKLFDEVAPAGVEATEFRFREAAQIVGSGEYLALDSRDLCRDEQIALIQAIVTILNAAPELVALAAQPSPSQPGGESERE